MVSRYVFYLIVYMYIFQTDSFFQGYARICEISYDVRQVIITDCLAFSKSKDQIICVDNQQTFSFRSGQKYENSYKLS